MCMIPRAFVTMKILVSSNLFSIVFETESQGEAQLIQICGDPPDPHLPGPGVPSVSLYGQLLTS